MNDKKIELVMWLILLTSIINLINIFFSNLYLSILGVIVALIPVVIIVKNRSK